MSHAWGLCEAKVKIPDILFQRVINCYISVVYYGTVSAIGKKVDSELGVVKVDAWKSSFVEEELEEAATFFFCDALPSNYQQLIKDEVRKHPLRGVAPATIGLSTTKAKEVWETFVLKFRELEGEIEGWVKENLEQIPNATPNFRFGQPEAPPPEEDGHNYYF